jgi:hypothetical protein
MRTSHNLLVVFVTGASFALLLTSTAASATALADPAPFCADDEAPPAWLEAFGPLSDQLGDVMGQPTECAQPAAESGDTLQLTTTGLAILRQPLGIPTFTDGTTHWALTDRGLVDWTSPSLDPPRRELPCGTLPIRGFGQVYGTRGEPFDLLGCPTSAETALDVVSQRFERGWMFWRAPRMPGDPPAIYALFDDTQRYIRFDDTFVAGADPVTGSLVPPAGLFQPSGGIGKVWREATAIGVRDRLGWATTPEASGMGSIETFQRGFMVWATGPKMIFLLAASTNNRVPQTLQTWRVYPDTFVE